EADTDRDPGARAHARLEVRDVIGGRLRLDDTTLHAVLLRSLKTDKGKVVERLVVQTADVGDETGAEGGVVRSRRRATAQSGEDGRQEHRRDGERREREPTLPHLDDPSYIYVSDQGDVRAYPNAYFRR